MIAESYIPSSHERKKAVLMYLLLGIFIVSIKGEVTEYELFHMKQATGWWTISCLIWIVSVVLLFVPLLRIIPLLIVGVMIVRWAYSVYQARKGHFNNTPGAWWLLVGVGWWLFDLFDLSLDVRYEQYVNTAQIQSQWKQEVQNQETKKMI